MQFACLPTGSIPSLFSSSLCVASYSPQPFLCISMQLQRKYIHTPLSLCRLFRSISPPHLQTTHPCKCALACKSCLFLPVERHPGASLPLPHTSTNYICNEFPARPFSPFCLRLAVSPTFFHRPPLLALFHRPPPMTQSPTVDAPPPPLHDDFGERRCGVILLHRTKKAYALLDLP